MEEKKSLNYIFYLQCKEKLDNHYYQLVEIFHQLSITLVPITARELRNLEQNKKHHLIVLRNDFASASAFMEMQKSFLMTYMATDKIALYDLSSFSELNDANKFYTKDIYRYIPLPCSLNQVAMTIATDFYRRRQGEPELWPGGKRARLPSMDI